MWPTAKTGHGSILTSGSIPDRTHRWRVLVEASVSVKGLMMTMITNLVDVF